MSTYVYLCLCQGSFLHFKLRLQQFEVLRPAFSFCIAGGDPQIIIQRHVNLHIDMWKGEKLYRNRSIKIFILILKLLVITLSKKTLK